jgi:hypothetical protein
MQSDVAGNRDQQRKDKAKNSREKKKGKDDFNRYGRSQSMHERRELIRIEELENEQYNDDSDR